MIPVAYSILTESDKEEVTFVLARKIELHPCDIESILGQLNPTLSIYRMKTNIHKVEIPIENDRWKFDQMITKIKGGKS